MDCVLMTDFAAEVGEILAELKALVQTVAGTHDIERFDREFPLWRERADARLAAFLPREELHRFRELPRKVLWNVLRTGVDPMAEMYRPALSFLQSLQEDIAARPKAYGPQAALAGSEVTFPAILGGAVAAPRTSERLSLSAAVRGLTPGGRTSAVILLTGVFLAGVGSGLVARTIVHQAFHREAAGPVITEMSGADSATRALMVPGQPPPEERDTPLRPKRHPARDTSGTAPSLHSATARAPGTP
jgi:hypothetical protein